ncbi:hypothetical protein GOP47_0003876 [Adiantum capillus-veneris]|uniref:Terpene synthase n=1 Tax=Adiantum capillus-veneris TaxID=13818 RepID=A0A9D4V743_ADICA|nr:hypothetical protein GOP47_0003873 [Adiantum capillus-veneris]KAI5080693.1 hypothetical protein GOP47_0003876 [Adiantum capillus-veneris]
MRAHLSPQYQARFRHSLQRYAAAAATQVAWRQAALVPDLYTYIANRRSSAAMDPFFILLESGLDVEFDPSLLDSPLLTLLRSAVADHVAWVNDLFSFKGEYAQSGDICNILAIVFLQPCSPGYGDLQKSVDIVCKMIEVKLQNYIHIYTTYCHLQISFSVRFVSLLDPMCVGVSNPKKFANVLIVF